MNQFPEKDFNGTLEGITLADIVQMACLERYERKLEVWGRGFHGVVYFSEGEIVHAETGDLTGNEAFVEIMCCSAGTFSFTPGSTDRQSIHVSWNFLLMESVREVDERNDIQHDKREDSRLKVLVVDDSRIFSKALVKLFDEDLGARIIGKASNGKEALKYLELEKPDLITLDINMPVMGGDVALKHILIRAPVPVILVSSFSEKNFPMMMQYLCIGAVELVAKPKDSVSWNIVEKRLGRLVRNIHQCNVKNIRRAKNPEPVKTKNPLGGKVKKLLLILGGLGGLIELQKILVAIKQTKDAAGLIFLDLYPGVTTHLASYFDNLTTCNPISLESGAPLLASNFGITYWHGSWEIVADNDGTIVPEMRSETGLLDADELLKSAAGLFGDHLSVIILSGTDLEMKAGLAQVKDRGGKILLQNPESSLFPEPLIKLQEKQIHDCYIESEKITDCLGDFFK